MGFLLDNKYNAAALQSVFTVNQIKYL